MNEYDMNACILSYLYAFMQCYYIKFAIPLKICLINRRFLSSTFPSLVCKGFKSTMCRLAIAKYTYCKLLSLMQIIFFSLDNICNIQGVTPPLPVCGFRPRLCVVSIQKFCYNIVRPLDLRVPDNV